MASTGSFSLRNATALVMILAFYVGTITTIYKSFPEVRPEERVHLKYPRTIDDAKLLGRVLSHYKNEHFLTVLSGIATVYLILQSFAIPGSIFLTILSGYLFPFPLALALVCLCSAIGAAVCYLISYTFGHRLIMHYFPDRVAKWRNEVQRHGGNWFNYIVFLRVTPILPNWFINLASPLIEVPVLPFFFGTLAGVAPPSFLFIQAGTTLQLMTSANAVWSWSSVGLLAFFAVLSLAPVLYNSGNGVANAENGKTTNINEKNATAIVSNANNGNATMDSATTENGKDATKMTLVGEASATDSSFQPSKSESPPKSIADRPAATSPSSPFSFLLPSALHSLLLQKKLK